VAGVAFDIFMRAAEWILGLVVVKPDRAPFYLIVTGVAFRAETASMDVLQPVTRYASPREILVDLIHVAGGAIDALMGAFQGEFGLAVVERLYLLPVRLAVAAIAFFTEIALMRLDFLVAIDT
jgi:hypothetical protein